MFHFHVKKSAKVQSPRSHDGTLVHLHMHVFFHERKLARCKIFTSVQLTKIDQWVQDTKQAFKIPFLRQSYIHGSSKGTQGERACNSFSISVTIYSNTAKCACFLCYYFKQHFYFVVYIQSPCIWELHVLSLSISPRK